LIISPEIWPDAANATESNLIQMKTSVGTLYTSNVAPTAQIP